MSFERQWSARLTQAKVNVFHATDFYGFHGEFAGWSRKKHNKYAKLFTAIAADNTEIAVGRAIEVAAYQELLAPVLASSIWSPHGRITPKMWCARTTLESLVVTHRRFLQSEPLSVVFEAGDGTGEVN